MALESTYYGSTYHGSTYHGSTYHGSTYYLSQESTAELQASLQPRACRLQPQLPACNPACAACNRMHLQEGIVELVFSRHEPGSPKEPLFSTTALASLLGVIFVLSVCIFGIAVPHDVYVGRYPTLYVACESGALPYTHCTTVPSHPDPYRIPCT